MVCENLPEDIIQSAITDINIENSHIAKYGNADKIPFYK